MEFLKKTARRRSLLSNIAYYALNLGMVAVLFWMSQEIHYPLAAIVLVLLSKWRTLSVRPKFWLTNIQGSLVDVVVGLGVVALMYAPQATLELRIALAVFYAAWLVAIKPLSKRWQMTLQAGLAVFIGTAALFAVSHEWPAAVVVLGALIIGYGTARHFLSTFREEQITVLSLAWGLVFAEIGWLAHYWTFGYALLGVNALQLPQATIVFILLSFVAERVYTSWHKHKTIVVAEVAGPAILASALILTILLFFNSVTL